MNGKLLEEADQFKYLGSAQTKDGTSLQEITTRQASTFSHAKASITMEQEKPTNWGTKAADVLENFLAGTL